MLYREKITIEKVLDKECLKRCFNYCKWLKTYFILEFLM